MRVGIGFDMHPLREGRRLVLGGVEIPFPRGLDGHSDADVLTHAVIDALLGAAAAGDIGSRCGTDAPWTRDVQSLQPLLPAMRANLARALRGAEGQVSVKGTTAKRMGLLGAGEGIAALAVVALLPALPLGERPHPGT